MCQRGLSSTRIDRDRKKKKKGTLCPSAFFFFFFAWECPHHIMTVLQGTPAVSDFYRSKITARKRKKSKKMRSACLTKQKRALALKPFHKKEKKKKRGRFASPVFETSQNTTA